MNLWLAVLLALLLACWATGAQQRLTRLRAQVIAAFLSVSETGQRLINLIHAVLDVPLQGANAAWLAPSAMGGDNVVGERALPAGDAAEPLRGALLQYVAALAAAQSRPMSAETLSALNAAQQLLWSLWLDRLASGRPASDVAPKASATSMIDTAVPDVDASRALLASQWLQTEGQYRLTVERFNAAVDEHNLAIRQFPAVLLARVMSLQPAVPLTLPPTPTELVQST